MGARSFKDLNVWRKAYDLTLSIYKVTMDFPDTEKFGITNQLRRASVSICSNIAEGFGRKSVKEKDQFYSIAHGSLTEVENQLLICFGVGYLSKDTLGDLMGICTEVEKMLSRLQIINKEKGEK
ncbi:four helix bundle protein [Candidatus Saccharibacteria bacterium]|nr:four helix bundle protein [Candidatus Saccharibacteria bacterium]